jgi:pantetheine-phosphate adenylyltransferase
LEQEECAVIRAVYPGSFDPFTNGHLDITQRGATLFDELIVAVLVNADKSSMFSVEERQMMTREAIVHLPNVRVMAFEGLLVDFMRLQQSRVILRGLRALSDFEYEFQLAQMNKQLAPETETFFMVTDAKYSYLSSRGVKEVFNFGGAIQEFVPPGVFRRMRERVQPRRSV